jgi:hypothetical protein
MMSGVASMDLPGGPEPAGRAMDVSSLDQGIGRGNRPAIGVHLQGGFIAARGVRAHLWRVSMASICHQ